MPSLTRCILPVPGAIALLLLASGACDRSRALDAAAMQAMVIVRGDEGRGSAFVVNMEGKNYLVTNSHVVRGNRNLTFKSLRNAEVATGPLEIADKVDAVRAEVAGATDALELEPQVEKVKIGDAVVVAGNAEGEGVVREIPGKVVGVGPDRIEVDAEFVPGNSGSPILLKSTGKVIGVATYLKIPRGMGSAVKSPTSLNEVRRFGYRLDTVAKWVQPPQKDRLVMEGLKLAEMENLMSSIVALFRANAGAVTKWGMSSYVSKEKSHQYPAFAALALAIDDFAKNQATAKKDDERTKNATAFFAKLKSIVSDDVRGLHEDQFSGFYGLELKEALARDKEFFDWCDGTAMPAYRELWLSSKTDSRFAGARGSSAPSIDPAKLHLVLSDRTAPNDAAENLHRVGYPSEMQPANLENLFWIIDDPNGDRKVIKMRQNIVRVHTLINGVYRVYVEFRGSGQPVVVSNFAEVKPANLAGTGASPTAPPSAILATSGPVSAKTSRSVRAVIAANSPDAVLVEGIHKGTKITFQYVGGKWKSFGRIGSENPDLTASERGDACRLVVALPSENGVAGRVLAMVAPETQQQPFVFEADADYPKVVLRINDQDNTYEKNPGSVEYEVKIVVPGS